MHKRLFHVSNLDAYRSMTFDTFDRQGRMGLAEEKERSLEVAFNQAKNFSENKQGWLVMLGTYGCGKTHLAAAIANSSIDAGAATLMLNVPDLLDWLRFALEIRESTFETRFEQIRNIPLLVLDDLGAHNATPWAQEKLFQILDYRYVNRLPTVITSNQDIDELEGRIRSRLVDPDVVVKVSISAPDYRSPTLEDPGKFKYSSLPLHSKRTFGTFNLRERENLSKEDLQSIKKAFRAAQQFSEKPRGWLVFTGGYASGKTHLAAAIGNYRAALGEEPMMVVVPDLLDHLRATFSPSSTISYDHLFNKVRTAPLLILDDMGTQSATPWAREKLYQIYNYRYNAELPTVITTSQPIEQIDPRIQSRMLDIRLCTIYALTVDSYRHLKK